MIRRAQRLRPSRLELACSSATPGLCGVLSLAALVALGLGASASASGAGMKEQASPPRVIRVVATTVAIRVLVDRAPKGLSKRDTIWTASVLANAVPQLGRPKGSFVGKDAGRAVEIGTPSETADVVATLPGGTLRIRGKSRSAGATEVLPVVGGTGAFRGVTGTLSIKDIDGGPRSSNIYRLRYPPDSRTVAADS